MPADGSPAIEEGGMSVAVFNATYANISRANLTGSLHVVGGPNASADETVVRLFPPAQGERNKIEFWNITSTSPGACRPLSIETHGREDVYDPAHGHVTFYTMNTDCSDYTQKALQWEWGPDFKDQLEVVMNLHPQKELFMKSTVKVVRNSTETTATSFPVGLILANDDQTAGNGFALSFSGKDDAGGEYREFSGIRSTFSDRTSTSIDGVLSFWTTIANARTMVAEAGPNVFKFYKRIEGASGASINGSVIVGGTGSTTSLQSNPGGNGDTLYTIDPTNGETARAGEVRICRSSNLAECRFIIYAGDNTNTPTFQVNGRAGDITKVNDITLGGEIDWTSSALGTCNSSSTNRGREVWVEGGAGVADEKYICRKDASDVYAWQKATWT